MRIGVRTGVGLLWLAGHSWCAAQALSFAQAAELARQNDPRLQMARQDLAVRRAQMEQAYGQLLPNASLSYSRFDGNRKTSGATSFPPTNFVSENTTLSVRQPLYRKALGAGYQKSKALLQSSEQELNKEEMELSLRTLQAYLEV
ncbi:TolC family protein, partial [Limnohabitans sp.]|uniref:TolC family protein n=1 Tax=Limnohabitans sp. TaxID=1907725 RepID=UPI0037BE8E8F